MPETTAPVQSNHNKFLAIIVVLIIIVVVYQIYSKKNSSSKEKATNAKKSSKSKKTGKREISKTKKSPKKKKPAETNERKRNNDDIHNDVDDDSSTDDSLNENAEELYNLVHESMSSGMTQEEFEEASQDLATSFTFIELRQLYNQCNDKNLDPSRTITVDDYIRVLKQE